MSDYTLHLGDCLSVLKTLPAGSVQTVVTSPPYFGLRDYGTGKWEGGSPECDHKAPAKGGTGEASYISVHGKRNDYESGGQYSQLCSKCGAIRIDEQIGLEETPQEYVDKLVAVFRECWRVMRDDAILWLNLGDSYATSPAGNKIPSGFSQIGNKRNGKLEEYNTQSKGWGSCKLKDLLGIPWRVAFALQADGWYLRSDIIWAKPNPMPESVTDRPTKSHEYIFLLSKQEQYFYDAEAIAENCSESTHARISQDLANQIGSYRANGGGKSNGPMKAVIKGSTRKLAEAGSGIRQNKSFEAALALKVEKRNRRSVWTIPSHAFKDAHFATFPPKLIEPCILAGSKVGDIVLDPFNGSGTTGLVALKHHRKYIGIELNPAYIEMSHRRLAEVQPVLLGL